MTDTLFREALNTALIFGAADVVVGGPEKSKSNREQHIEEIAKDYPAEEHAQGLLEACEYVLNNYFWGRCYTCERAGCNAKKCECPCHENDRIIGGKLQTAIASVKKGK